MVVTTMAPIQPSLLGTSPDPRSLTAAQEEDIYPHRTPGEPEAERQEPVNVPCPIPHLHTPEPR